MIIPSRTRDLIIRKTFAIIDIFVAIFYNQQSLPGLNIAANLDHKAGSLGSPPLHSPHKASMRGETSKRASVYCEWWRGGWDRHISTKWKPDQLLVQVYPGAIISWWSTLFRQWTLWPDHSRVALLPGLSCSDLPRFQTLWGLWGKLCQKDARQRRPSPATRHSSHKWMNATALICQGDKCCVDNLSQSLLSLLWDDVTGGCLHQSVVTKCIDNIKPVTSQCTEGFSVLSQSCLCWFMEMTTAPPLHCTSSDLVMPPSSHQEALISMRECPASHSRIWNRFPLPLAPVSSAQVHYS